MGLPDAQQLLSAAAATLQISPFAMGLTRQPDFRTSSRLANFLHRNLRFKAVANGFVADISRPKSDSVPKPQQVCAELGSSGTHR
jgi:hypothetical protein